MKEGFKIIVLHICAITNNKSSGLSIVVPEHIKYQSEKIKVGVLNCTNNKILKFDNQDKFDVFYLNNLRDENLNNLPKPFNKPDLVNFHGVYIYKFTKLAKQLRKNNIPYIITPHGSLTYFSQNKKKIKKYFGNKLLFNRFIDEASTIHYLTDNEKKHTFRYHKNEIVVGNGIEINRNKRVINKNKDYFNMIFIGRLDIYHKGIDLLLEACNLIKDKMKKFNIKLKIFGPDHEGGKEKIIRLIKEKGIDEVVFVGEALYDEDKEKELNNSDVFILTSRFEGQPLGVLEALSKGIPVIITEGTNISEIVDMYNCGFTAKNDSYSISEQILNAYAERNNFDEYSFNSIKCSEKNFSWDYISNQTIEFYKGIIN